jgi:hypothetical protein
MGDAVYRLRLKKGDFEVEVQGDRDFVVTKFDELTKGKIVPGTIESVEAEGTVELPDTLVEYVKLKGDPREHTDLVVIFAYWLFKKENIDTFNIRDMESCYSKARVPKPGNLSDKMYKNEGKALLVRADEQKDGLAAWRITRTGEEYVEKMKGS